MLTVNPATYVGYGTNAFPVHANPGFDYIVTVYAISIQINEAKCQYLLLRTHYNIYHPTDRQGTQ